MENSSLRPLLRPSALLRILEATLGCWTRVRRNDRINAEQLADLAVRRVRLGNFDDLRFLPAMQSLLEAFQTAPLTHIGRQGLYDMVRLALVRRLWLQHELQRSPDIRNESIRTPFIIVGFPRSGTTLLHNLLRASAGCRWLRAWEIEPPFPETKSWGTSQDPRRREFEGKMAIADRKNPYIYQLHPADSPAECWRLLWPSFHCDAIFLYFGFHCYHDWRDSTTARGSEEAYSLHRTQLQFLQQRSPGSHWVLKSPEHAINLSTLLKIYPDARIIHLHREPRDVIASLCNLAAAFQPAMVHNLSGRQLGHQVTQVFATWSQQILLSRSRLPNDRICDITYSDLVANPLETARSIYQYFKTPFDLTFLDLPTRAPETHAAPIQPGPKYDLQRFNLDATEIDSLSEKYRHRFLH